MRLSLSYTNDKESFLVRWSSKWWLSMVIKSTDLYVVFSSRQDPSAFSCKPIVPSVCRPALDGAFKENHVHLLTEGHDGRRVGRVRVAVTFPVTRESRSSETRFLGFSVRNGGSGFALAERGFGQRHHGERRYRGGNRAKDTSSTGGGNWCSRPDAASELAGVRRWSRRECEGI